MGQASFFVVNLETPFGPIKGKVSIETGPMCLAELVPTALELTTVLVERSCHREEQAGRKISCGPGCGVCCSQMVPLSPPEAFYLVDVINALTPDHRQPLLKRFDAIIDILRKHKMIDRVLHPDYSDDEVLPIARKYFHLTMQCPFLAKESCSIHPSRPVACREYTVTSPPSWCADPYQQAIAKVPMPMPLSAPLARLTATLTNSVPRLIPLVLAPLWVAENAALKERQWPGVELFQAFMHQIGSQQKEIHRGEECGK